MRKTVRQNNFQSKVILRQVAPNNFSATETKLFVNVSHVTVIYMLRRVQLPYLEDYKIKFSKSRSASDPAVPGESNPPPGNGSVVPPHTILHEK